MPHGGCTDSRIATVGLIRRVAIYIRVLPLLTHIHARRRSGGVPNLRYEGGRERDCSRWLGGLTIYVHDDELLMYGMSRMS
jgi:hypothetical protein